jgi:hypothetical protein
VREGGLVWLRIVHSLFSQIMNSPEALFPEFFVRFQSNCIHGWKDGRVNGGGKDDDQRWFSCIVLHCIYFAPGYRETSPGKSKFLQQTR